MAQIPFDISGNMVNYEYDRFIAEWKDNFEFKDEIQFSSFSRGQSSAKAIFTSNIDNKQYFIFLADLGNIIKHGIEKDGIIKGTFTFQKRGSNYGIKLVK